MKKFENLLSEMKQVYNREELESAADLFNYGIDKGSYNMTQAKQYNEVFWNIKNRLITKEIYKLNPRINYLNLLAIVTGASIDIKEDKQKLAQYINERLKVLKNNNRKLA